VSGQLQPLVALRWHMVRSRRAQWGFLALAATVPVLCVGTVVLAMLVPTERRFDVTLLTPTAYLSVAVLAVLAPLVAGGGNELFPPEQLSAYPVTSRTYYSAALALTPLNLAWVSQLVGLVGVTAYVAGDGWHVVLPLVTCLAYIAAVTVAGQALAWTLVGMRARRGGRVLTWSLGAGVAGVFAAVLATGHTVAVLDRAPTAWVVIGALDGASTAGEDLRTWALDTGALVLACWVGVLLGRRACDWSLRQPGQQSGEADTRRLRRRPVPAGALKARLAIDRASVWRSRSLRRGLLVLGVLPGVAAALADLPWSSLVLLPALVSAGAGLLFGVNAFCLDGSGAIWLGSLPGDARTALRAKGQVIAEVCGVAVVIAVLAGSVRLGRWPGPTELLAMLACALVSVTRVVATCLHLSVTHPYRADLRGPRDTPAPPGVMAAYSVRLAVSTTFVAIWFSLVSDLADWRYPILLAAPLLLLTARRLVAVDARWADATVRAEVVGRVADG
jgi:hypothetical protein